MKRRFAAPSLRSAWTVGLIFAALICLPTLPAAAAAEGSFQRALQVTGPVHLDLTTGSGNVEVHTGSSNQVRVTGHIRASEWFGGKIM